MMKAQFIVCVLLFLCGIANGDNSTTLDFQKLISAPLQAINQAQEDMIKSSFDYVTDILFNVDANGTKSINYWRVTYPKVVNGTTVNHTIEVPLVLLMPVPYIQIDVIRVAFNIKLDSVDDSSGSSQFQASFSSRKTIADQTTEQDYSVTIIANAVAAPPPRSTANLAAVIKDITDASGRRRITPNELRLAVMEKSIHH